MATGYTEPSFTGSGPPAPYRSEWDDKFSCVFDQMCRFLNRGYAITDLQGLELLGQLLYQIDKYETLRKNKVSKMSLAFTKMKLKEIVELLKNFRPMLLETTNVHLIFSQRFNFERCFDDFLTYIDEMSSKLISIAQGSATGTAFIVDLQRIQFDVANIQACVDEKFHGYPLAECDTNFLYWTTRTSYATDIYFPYGVFTMILQFAEDDSEFLPPWLFPRNTKIIEKVCFKTMDDLQGQALGAVCSLCKINVCYILNMSVLQGCDHVFCFTCLKTWLLVNCTDKWMCPTCRASFDGYGSIQGSLNDRSVSFLIPPHNIILTIEFYRRVSRQR